MSQFPLIDQYLGIQLDIPVPEMFPGEMMIVETNRRLRCEQSYGFIHAVFGIWFVDGRVAVSLPPGVRRGAVEGLEEVKGMVPPFDPTWIARLSMAVNQSLDQAGLPPVQKAYDGRQFACKTDTLRRWEASNCRRLCDESVLPTEGLSLPAHCFPDGIVYGVVEAGQVVSVAYAHRSGILEDKVVDLGVETAAAYRRRGFAKACVSAVTAHMIERGGEGMYNCSESNLASMATARSVGYKLNARVFILTTNISEKKED